MTFNLGKWSCDSEDICLPWNTLQPCTLRTSSDWEKFRWALSNPDVTLAVTTSKDKVWASFSLRFGHK